MADAAGISPPPENNLARFQSLQASIDRIKPLVQKATAEREVHQTELDAIFAKYGVTSLSELQGKFEEKKAKAEVVYAKVNAYVNEVSSKLISTDQIISK